MTHSNGSSANEGSPVGVGVRAISLAADVDLAVVSIGDSEHQDAGHDEEVEGEDLDLSDARPDALPDKEELEGDAEELQPDRPPEEAVVVGAVSNSGNGAAINGNDLTHANGREASIVAVGLELKGIRASEPTSRSE